MSEFSVEYGKALYSLAKDENIVEDTLAELLLLKEILNGNKEYISLIDTPALPLEERLGLIDSAFSSSSLYLRNFLKILSEKRSFCEIFECIKEFQKLYDTDNNIERVTAVTCVPLSEEQAKKLEDKIGGITGKKVVIINEIDKNILGGVILKLKNSQYDGSIKSRLKKLEDMLKN